MYKMYKSRSFSVFLNQFLSRSLLHCGKKTINPNFRKVKFSSEAVQHPISASDLKQYSPKLHNIVNEISSLNLLEVSELNELLKKTLKIPDAPMMPVGTMPGVMSGASAGAEEEEEETSKVVKTSFAVKLVKFDDTKKVQLIKEIKSLMPDMNLVQAKKFVESAPQIIKADLGKDEADKLLDAVTAAGGICEIE